MANTLFLICRSQLNEASAENDYDENCRAQWEAKTVTHCPGLGVKVFVPRTDLA